MTMEDSDLKQRLRLAQEKIAKQAMEIEELLDMRSLIMVLAKEIAARPTAQKKSPAERRAEMTRLWAAERNKS